MASGVTVMAVYQSARAQFCGSVATAMSYVDVSTLRKFCSPSHFFCFLKGVRVSDADAVRVFDADAVHSSAQKSLDVVGVGHAVIGVSCRGRLDFEVEVEGGVGRSPSRGSTSSCPSTCCTKRPGANEKGSIETIMD